MDWLSPIRFDSRSQRSLATSVRLSVIQTIGLFLPSGKNVTFDPVVDHVLADAELLGDLLDGQLA
jgi:hypothetical protein